MVRKIINKIAVILFLIASCVANAAGPYDGIWSLDEASELGYFVASENNGKIIIAGLSSPDSDGVREWGAVWGDRVNNKVRLTRLIDDNIDLVIDVTFTSDTTFTFKQISCTPLKVDYECRLPNGAMLNGSKIW